MANVHDVAAYILARNNGSMSAMKLEKLVYYSQAWHLVWEDQPLFSERVEAWANGPVVYELYDKHRGEFTLSHWQYGDPAKLTASETGTIDSILSFYGHQTAFWLSELTHSEPPWRDARGGLAPGQRGNSEITPAAMAEYYSGLVSA